MCTGRTLYIFCWLCQKDSCNKTNNNNLPNIQCPLLGLGPGVEPWVGVGPEMGIGVGPEVEVEPGVGVGQAVPGVGVGAGVGLGQTVPGVGVGVGLGQAAQEVQVVAKIKQNAIKSDQHDECKTTLTQIKIL